MGTRTSTWVQGQDKKVEYDMETSYRDLKKQGKCMRTSVQSRTTQAQSYTHRENYKETRVTIRPITSNSIKAKAKIKTQTHTTPTILGSSIS